MTPKSNTNGRQPSLLIDSEVARKIRQHAHSSTQAEICGVLIGQDRDGVIKINASITGLNAEEAGAHVTFTQDTWEHIYKVKDKEFPGERIVGWYHSHPGFGIFLSEHDSFIHKNFFSSPGQVAWVVDPLSDEEGCFGWVSGRIERLNQIAVVDRRGGERADDNLQPEPNFSTDHRSDHRDPEITLQSNVRKNSGDSAESYSLQRLVGTIFSHLSAILVGILVAWYIFPRIEIVAVPVDPRSGQPLIRSMQDSPATAAAPDKARPQANQSASQPVQNGNTTKGDHAQPK